MNAIYGTGQRHWLRLPNVTAPHPDDRTKTVNLTFSEDLVYKLAAASRLSPIFQLWAHVVGELPPINNIRRLETGPVKPTLTTLSDSVAAFRGVKRPYDDEPEGDSVVVYVLNPLVSIDYEPSMVCLAKAVRMPPNVAMTVQVKPKPLQANGQAVDKPGMTEIFGVVTRLEPVPGNAGTPLLPKGHDQRYTQRLWT